MASKAWVYEMVESFIPQMLIEGNEIAKIVPRVSHANTIDGKGERLN